MLTKVDRNALNVGHLDAGPEHADQVNLGTDQPPSCADRVVVGVAGNNGKVPTLNDGFILVPRQGLVIGAEAFNADDMPFGGRWLLLVLRCKREVSEFLADLFQRRFINPFGKE